jgi:exopolysaccharide biosynthesis polyprenyl glycosylphosphotransferase
MPHRAAQRSAAAVRRVPRLGAEPPAFVLLVDLLALVSAFLLGYVVTPIFSAVVLARPAVRARLAPLSPRLDGPMQPLDSIAWALVVMAAVAVVCIQATGGYRALVDQSRTRVVATVIGAMLAAISVVTWILVGVRNDSFSRVFLLLDGAFAVTALSAHRLLLRWYRLKRLASGFYSRDVILIGSPRALGWLSVHVANNTSIYEYSLAGYLSVSPSQMPIPYDADGEACVLPCLGDVTRLGSLLVSRPVHEVVAVQGDSTDWLPQVVEECDYFRVTLRIVPETLVFGQLRDLQVIYHSDPLRLPEIVLRPRHHDSAALFIKRLIDIVVSGSLLVVLAPLFAVIAIAIKLTTPRLPVFYRWNVVGLNGRPFTGFKFSTMIADADARRNDLLARNEMHGPVFKMRFDPRITPLGRWLRKFSLNELPQLWSVLNGDMSLVGPRPAFPHELERYELWHKRKLSVRPGITCLWQIRGRNRIVKFDDWVRMDFEYIDNWSLWLDMKILLRTAWAVLGGSGW